MISATASSWLLFTAEIGTRLSEIQISVWWTLKEDDV